MLKKILGSVGAALVVLLAVGWIYRVEIALNAPGVLLNFMNPVGPNQEIVWTKGPDVAELPPSERPPNIIFIVTDDMGFNDISYYGGGASGSDMQTPHIDALAHEGVAFTNGYAGTAVCAPSRAMIMTGRYATRFGFNFTPTCCLLSDLSQRIVGLRDHIRTFRLIEMLRCRLMTILVCPRRK